MKEDVGSSGPYLRLAKGYFRLVFSGWDCVAHGKILTDSRALDGQQVTDLPCPPNARELDRHTTVQTAGGGGTAIVIALFSTAKLSCLSQDHTRGRPVCQCGHRHDRVSSSWGVP